MHEENHKEILYGSPLKGSGVRVGYGRGQSKTFGDLVFIHNGSPAIIFSNIEDPYGRKSMADAARKSRLKKLKEQNKISSPNALSVKQYDIQHSYSTVCPKCGIENRADAKYCDDCGEKISILLNINQEKKILKIQILNLLNLNILNITLK